MNKHTRLVQKEAKGDVSVPTHLLFKPQTLFNDVDSVSTVEI